VAWRLAPVGNAESLLRGSRCDFAGDFNDLYSFDPCTCIWKNLTDLVVGPVPSPRRFPGFASAGGKLYLFGGVNIEAGNLSPASSNFCCPIDSACIH
jgi:hypothetical protein